MALIVLLLALLQEFYHFDSILMILDDDIVGTGVNFIVYLFPVLAFVLLLF